MFRRTLRVRFRRDGRAHHWIGVGRDTDERAFEVTGFVVAQDDSGALGRKGIEEVVRRFCDNRDIDSGCQRSQLPFGQSLS